MLIRKYTFGHVLTLIVTFSLCVFCLIFVPSDLPQQHVCKKVERIFAEAEPPQIKEEEEELCISQETEQLVLKKEITVCMRKTFEESEENEPGLNSDPSYNVPITKSRGVFFS